MILADQGAACPAYHLCWVDYLQTQFSPAHLLSELGFALAFELLQVVLIVWLWRKVIKPRMTRTIHTQIDAEHNIEHHNDHVHSIGPEEPCVTEYVPKHRRHDDYD